MTSRVVSAANDDDTPIVKVSALQGENEAMVSPMRYVRVYRVEALQPLGLTKRPGPLLQIYAICRIKTVLRIGREDGRLGSLIATFSQGYGCARGVLRGEKF